MDDDRAGICAECGGNIIYIYALNTEVCDTCEYEKEEVM